VTERLGVAAAVLSSTLGGLAAVAMTVAALLRAELFGIRKISGVLIASAGVALALTTGLGEAPPGAWRGDLLMIGSTLAMAFYNVWSRPFIARSSPLGFVTACMGFHRHLVGIDQRARDLMAVTRPPCFIFS